MAQRISKIVLTDGGVWDSSKTYPPYTYVRHNGDGWWSTRSTTASEPAKGNADWVQATDTQEFIVKLKEATSEAQAITDSATQAEQLRVEAEQARMDAENERNADENLRKLAEAERIAEESKRQNAEKGRVAAEAVRDGRYNEAEENRNTVFLAAESERQTAEETRKQAEAARIQAENERDAAEQLREALTVETKAAAADAKSATKAANTAAGKANEAAGKANQVADKVTELDKAVGDFSQKNTEEEGFYICDAEGNVLIRLDVLDTKGGIGESLANSIRSIIQGVGATGFDSLEAQEIGTKLSKIINGFKDVKEVAEDGFYICNGDGEAVAKFIDDKWEFLGLTTGGAIPRKGAETEEYVRLSAGTYILGNFPKYLKMGRTVTLSADVEQFDTIEIGVINTTKRTITIDSTNITLATDGTSRKTEAHGLTISGQLRVTFVADMFEAKAIIDCNGEQYIFKHTSDSYAYANHLDCSAYGNVGMIVGGSTILNNVVLSASSNYFGKDVWIFGDSYTSIDSGARWPNHVLFDFEYKNFMICGLSGGSSEQLYADLEKCLQYGTPKEIIWLLGMNNGDLADAPNTSWLENLEKVEKICEDNGIELVLGTIPCTNQQTNDNSFKNEVIKSRGHRYINFAKAVGAEVKGSSWYTGMKEPDPGIHPSELGAKVLAAQILADCPELTK